jgi:uncharacterized protein
MRRCSPSSTSRRRSTSSSSAPGTEIAHPPTAFRKAVEAAGVGVEPMASPQACRTYNVLLSEGRRVGAALLPVG